MSKTIEILFPVLNEENRLEKGIVTTWHYIEDQLSSYSPWDFRITIVDNGSTDKTPDIARNLCQQYSSVSYIQISERGVGAAFRAGLAPSTADIIGYMDIDLSTDIKHLKDVIDAFNQSSTLDLVNGSRLHKNAKMAGRKWYRNLSTRGLVLLLKWTLHLKASDAICGFKFFKRDTVTLLCNEATHEDGWFYIIELLLRAERRQCHILELPVNWEDEHQTKVHFFKLVGNYMKHIVRLFWTFRFKSRRR